jgi:arabinogalactan oligomer/maltooligosaccharide transport system substrate-binding protein
MRKWVVYLIISLLVFALAACAPDRGGLSNGADTGNNSGGNAQHQPTGGGSSEESKPDKLIVWSNDDAKHIAAVERLAAAFAEETGIPVEIVPVTGSEQVQKLALAAPAGNGPDLFYQPQDRLGDIVVQGLAEPLDLSADELAQYSEAAINAVQYEGEIYGFPISIETYAVFYNKELVDQVPAALEDVAKLSERLTNVASDQYAFLMVPDFYYTIPFITNYGGYIFGESNGKYDPKDLGLNNDGTVQGMTAYAKFVKDNSIPPTMTIDIMDTLFLEGKVGMVINGLWAMKPYSDQLGDKLGTAAIPTVNGKPATSFVGVKSWFISSYSKQPSWAKELALYLTSESSGDIYYEQTGEIPAHPDAQQNINDPLYAGFVAQIASGIPMPNIPEMSAVWEMDKAVDFIVQGDDPKSVLDEITEQIAAQIQTYGN